jgi:UbiD family decarboxylase
VLTNLSAYRLAVLGGGVPLVRLLTGQRDAVIADGRRVKAEADEVQINAARAIGEDPAVFLAGNTSRQSASANLAYQAWFIAWQLPALTDRQADTLAAQIFRSLDVSGKAFGI